MSLKNLLILISIIFFNIIPANSKTISFNTSYQKAKDNSYELKAYDLDIEISKEGVVEAKADYYPQLNAVMNMEKANDMTGGSPVISSVGDITINSNSRYQNYFALNTSYNVYDFGVRNSYLQIAKKDVKLKKLLYQEQLRELKLQLIDIYTRALKSYKKIQNAKNLLPIYDTLISDTTRLYKAGLVSKTKVSEQIEQKSSLINEIINQKTQLSDSLQDLSFYTAEEYNLEDIELLDFYDNNIVPVCLINHQDSLEYKIYDIQIQQKEKELNALKKSTLPKLSMYSKYGLYGSDKNDLSTSIKNYEDVILSVGFVSSMPIFDGHKNKAKCKKLELELKKLRFKRESAIKRFEKRQTKIKEKINLYSDERDNFLLILNEVNKKDKMIQRQFDSKVIDKIQMLNSKTNLMTQKGNYEDILVNITSSLETLKVISESNY